MTYFLKRRDLAGSSSGTLIAAAIKFCKAQKTKKMVTLVCDAGDKYLEKSTMKVGKLKKDCIPKK